MFSAGVFGLFVCICFVCYYLVLFDDLTAVLLLLTALLSFVVCLFSLFTLLLIADLMVWIRFLVTWWVVGVVWLIVVCFGLGVCLFLFWFWLAGCLLAVCLLVLGGNGWLVSEV